MKVVINDFNSYFLYPLKNLIMFSAAITNKYAY